MKSKRLRPRRMVVLGFLCVIAAGTILLTLPVSSASGNRISLVDSLFTATSAVCVTGLVSVDPGLGFSAFGQTVLAVLIQVGGLGIMLMGVIASLAAGGRLGIGKQRLVKESLNLSSGKGLMKVVRAVIYVTLLFEVAGALLSFVSFSRHYTGAKAVGISVFHSIASFNNAGFDILGNYKSLTDYGQDIWLNLVTCGLIICGGLGFFVISELVSRKAAAKWSLHTKVVLSSTGALLAAGTLLLKFTQGSSVSWLEAFFQSTSARTAGFATVPTGSMDASGLMVLMVLMFIGASPGSTGGGIKTTTFFVLLQRMRSAVFNRHCGAFRRKFPDTVVEKAFLVLVMAITVILCSTFFLCVLEPEIQFQAILFEAVSAFATTGLSTGITPILGNAAKLVLTVTMFVGRLGPLTMATIWLSREVPQVSYSEEDVTIG